MDIPKTKIDMLQNRACIYGYEWEIFRKMQIKFSLVMGLAYLTVLFS